MSELTRAPVEAMCRDLTNVQHHTKATFFLAHDAALRQQLAAARQQVWEEAARGFDEWFFATDHRLDHTRDHRVDEFYKWLCGKAKKAQP